MIHQALIQNSSWYRKWHQNPRHLLYHFTILMVVSLFFTTTILKRADESSQLASPALVFPAVSQRVVDPNDNTLPLTTIISTDKPSYDGNTTVTITSTVKSNGVSVAGATVYVVVTSATGKISNLIGKTNESGLYTISYSNSVKSAGSGTYSASSYATKSGYTNSSTVTVTFTR